MHVFAQCRFFPKLRHFEKGISTIKQWTAGDHKQLERVFICALVGTNAEPRVRQAACSLVDFVHLAEYHSHTDDTLAALQNALDDFHRLKEVFVENGCRNHFNIPKFHSLVHYTDTIRTLGSLDGLNTETSERLHIDFAKKAYAATNRKDYTVQMTRWLQRQEAVAWFSGYQAWRHRTDLSNEVEPSLSGDSDHHPSPDQDLQEPHAAQVHSRYQISRRPPFPKKTVQYLEQHHGAVCFLEALRAFVDTLPRGRQHFAPSINDRFDIFSNVVLITPPVEHAADVTSRIRSHPERPNGVRKPPTLARYDTVLVDVDTELRQQQGGLHGTLTSKLSHVAIYFNRCLQVCAWQKSALSSGYHRTLATTLILLPMFIGSSPFRRSITTRRCFVLAALQGSGCLVLKSFQCIRSFSPAI